MNPESAKTSTFWTETADIARFPTLTEAKTCDVCIVGGGITGLTAAYLLSKEGKSVVLVDDGPMCGGETQRTTAHVTDVLDTRYAELIRTHGLENVKSVFQAYRAAMDQIAMIVKDEEIDCDFEKLDGYLFLAPGSKQSELEAECKAVTEVGFAGVQLVNCLLARSEVVMSLRFPNQYQFHVLNYLDGVIDACVSQGVQIFANTHISGIDDGATVTVKKLNQENVAVSASAVIVATNSPILGLGIHTKQAAYRTYVIGARVPKGSVPKGLYWDTQDPYHYVRLQAIEDDENEELLIVGGEDHKTGQADDAEERFLRLEQWAHEHCTSFKSVDYKWSGQVYEPVDGIGYIGKHPGSKGIYIATGAGGVGMTFGTAAGILLTDALCDRANSALKIFDPARSPMSNPIEFLKENLNAVAQFVEYLNPSEVTSVAQIHPGEGAVLTRNGEKIAVCRDDKGNICERSAVCPHLGGIVAWNSLEKSWDCPVHGSRFDMNGKVIDGPANKDLGEATNKLTDEVEQETQIFPDTKAS